MQIRFLSLFLVLLLLSSQNNAQNNNYTFEEQSEEFPIYSSIDTTKLRQFKGLFAFGKIDLERFEELRLHLKPYLEKEDPLAMFLYAKTYDLGPYGINTKSTDSIAIIYYKKLVDMNCADVELMLHSAYKYGDIGLPVDYKKSREMLERAIIHGDDKIKAYGHFTLAHIYYEKKNKYGIKADTDKTIEYLEQTIKYDSTHTMAIDFLSSLYFDKSQNQKKKDIEYSKKLIKKSFDLMMMSPNDQSNLEAAQWLIEGKYVEKDVEKGVQIIIREAIIVQRDFPNIFHYMGSFNPVLMLNDLYHEGIISWEQVKRFYIKNYHH